MTSMADDIAWTRQLAIRLGPRAKTSMRWQIFKGIFRGLSSPANATERVQALVDVTRVEARYEENRLRQCSTRTTCRPILQRNSFDQSGSGRKLREHATPAHPFSGADLTLAIDPLRSLAVANSPHCSGPLGLILANPVQRRRAGVFRLPCGPLASLKSADSTLSRDCRTDERAHAGRCAGRHPLASEVM
jgi:hypothetical protein